MARFLSSNGSIIVLLDNIHLKLSKHANFEMCFHSILSEYEDSESIFL